MSLSYRRFLDNCAKLPDKPIINSSYEQLVSERSKYNVKASRALSKLELPYRLNIFFGH